MHSDSLAFGVNTFVALLAAALFLSIVAERARIPSAVLLVSAGIVTGLIWHVRPPFDFSQALLFVFLPPLIFEAAWNVSLDHLRKTWQQITLLAFPGTILVAFAIAGGIVALGALPFPAALLIGSIVAATDPVAVISVFRRFAVPDRVKTIVEAESISNDGVAVVLYGSALTLAMGGRVNWSWAALHGFVAIVGGVAIGTLLAFVAWRVVRLTDAAAYEVTLTVALAYGAYLAADRLALSGIFACATAGVVLRGLQQRSEERITNVDDADRFWDTTAYIANAVVFITTGLLIDLPRIVNEPLVIVTAVAIVFVSRGAIVALVIRDPRARQTVFLAGMRGALPLALALALPPEVPARAIIVDAVFAIVFFTLVLQGFALRPVIAKLYAPPTPVAA